MFKLWMSLRKDFRVLVRDGIGLALMFIMPIVLVFVVTDIQDSTFKMINKNKLPIYVCNRDTGASGKQLIQAINKRGTTIFMVEQNANMALSIATYGYVLQTGEVVLHGSAQSLRDNEMIQQAYLGEMKTRPQ